MSQNLKFKYNPTYNQMEATTLAKVISFAPDMKQTKTGKNFYPATVEINVNGTVSQFSAMCHEKNYNKGITIGEMYVVNVVRTAEQPDTLLLTLSALKALGQRATAEDFGLELTFEEMMIAAEVGAEEVK